MSTSLHTTASAPETTEALGHSWTLAVRVLDLARGLIVTENPFLSASLGLLDTHPAELSAPFAFNGKTLYVDADRLLAQFSRERTAPVHDLLHVLFHGVLLHPFVSASVDGAAWNLAADITAEALVAEVASARGGTRGARIGAVLKQLSADLGASPTTERLYRALRDGAYAQMRGEWVPLFYVDDHQLWPPAAAARQTQDAQAQTGEGNASQQGGPSNPDATGASSGAGEDSDRQEAQQSPGQSQDGIHQQGASDHVGNDTSPKDARSESEQGEDTAQTGREPNAESGTSSANRRAAPQPAALSQAERAEAEKKWNRASQSMRVDLETLSRTRGAGLGGLTRQLEVGAHKPQDYRSFLRQFAVEREHMRISDDEFDYIFYTYGLELYGNVPLVEPLEYKSEKRIRDFVIVIDTSSSVSAKVVQEFVNTTFDVLTSEGGFFAQTNIHIIQADARVQSDVKITSLADLDRWRRSIKLYGFGGTDFRPAFRYVQELRQSGEFDDLQGLVYFTDGWGIYPQRMPPYRCAFVFYDEDHRPELVPPWALQLVLHPGEFESLSVY